MTLSLSALLLLTTACAPDPEKSYLQSLKESAPRIYADYSSRDLVANGYEACNSLDSVSLTEVLDKALAGYENSEKSEQIEYWFFIYGASVNNLCTEYTDEFRQWLAANK